MLLLFLLALGLVEIDIVAHVRDQRAVLLLLVALAIVVGAGRELRERPVLLLLLISRLLE